jgi:hypothetical protein
MLRILVFRFAPWRVRAGRTLADFCRRFSFCQLEPATILPYQVRYERSLFRVVVKACLVPVGGSLAVRSPARRWWGLAGSLGQFGEQPIPPAQTLGEVLIAGGNHAPERHERAGWPAFGIVYGVNDHGLGQT